MSAIKLNQVTRKYGATAAVNDVSLEIQSGEFFSFLGPSGCGKTTLLRLISGFEELSSGQIFIGDQNMKGISPNKRPTALIFQNLALFPWMNVGENIAFGLRARKISQSKIKERIDELLHLVDLSGLGHRKITQISGGQRQRVAIARALAVEPQALLLDEPLSALDLKLKQRMRVELKSIQRKTGLTFIYITHDQGEALAMSDRIAVMRDGAIEQVGSPESIYQKPETSFVASFVGDMNRIDGHWIDGAAGEGTGVIETPLGRFTAKTNWDIDTKSPVCLMLRPENTRLHAPDSNSTSDSGRQILEGSIVDMEFEGAHLTCNVRLRNNTDFKGTDWKIRLIAPPEFKSEPGSPVKISFSESEAMLLNIG